MSEKLVLHHEDDIAARILTFHGQRVMVDGDLARVYRVTTKALNQAVKRNRAKFPADFMFRLTREEAVEWRRSRSQFVTLKRGQNIKYLPNAFTEHGAIMAATVLNSPRAVQMSVFVGSKENCLRRDVAGDLSSGFLTRMPSRKTVRLSDELRRTEKSSSCLPRPTTSP